MDDEVRLELRKRESLQRVSRERVLRSHEVVLGRVLLGLVEPLVECEEPDLLVVLPAGEIQDLLRLPWVNRVDCGGVDDRSAPPWFWLCQNFP